METNKYDYGEYPKAHRYVQEQLRKHQERATPAPMDIGNLDQSSDVFTPQKEQQQHKQEEEQNSNTEHDQTGTGGDDSL